ncbi:MAG TPA: cytochrome b562 [Phycisphaerales bacterium]|nr:cytochrome b562 [Phycisphaerales bacterium]
MKKITSVAALSGLVVAGAMLAAGMGQPGGAPGAGGGAGGQPPARGPGGGGRDGQPRQGQGLSGSMKAMDRALEALKSTIGDAAKKDDNLRLLGDAQRGAVNAKSARPTEALNGAKDDAERAAISTQYRKHLLDVLKALIDAEVATMDGKTDQAKAALDRVATLRDKGHKDLKVGEGEGSGDTGGGGRAPRTN